MKITLSQNGKQFDISNFVDGLTISGDIQQVARKCEFELINPAFDITINKLNPNLGAVILVTEGSDEIFRGVAWIKDLNSKSQNYKVTCYDYLIYALKNQAYYNFKKMTPEAMTKKMCDDFGIPVGTLAKTNISFNYIANNQTIYDAMMTAYTKAAKQNGKKYYPVMQGNKVNMIEKGSAIIDFSLSDDTNISEGTRQDSLDQMVNSVVVYDDKGAVVAKASDNEMKQKYGTVQVVLSKQDKQDNKAIAQNALKGIETKIQLTTLGNTNLRTGYSVYVNFKYLGLNKKMYIESDQHSWKNGVYTSQITVSFDNDMDEKEMNEN